MREVAEIVFSDDQLLIDVLSMDTHSNSLVGFVPSITVTALKYEKAE